jgi:hypothetical protein
VTEFRHLLSPDWKTGMIMQLAKPFSNFVTNNDELCVTYKVTTRENVEMEIIDNPTYRAYDSIKFNFGGLKKHETFADINISTSTKTFRAHKAILAGNCFSFYYKQREKVF